MGSKPSGISGSRSSAVLGQNPFKTRLGVWMDIIEDIDPGWLQKNGFTYEPFTGNASTRWGNAFENDIIWLAERAGGCKIGELEAEYTHPEHMFITCHIDGMYEDIVPILHEGKTTSSYTFREKWGEPGTNMVPREYFIQVQHQMMLTNAKKAIISVLVFPERPDVFENLGVNVDNIKTEEWSGIFAQMGYFHQYTIDEKPELQKLMLQEYIDFWNNHILKRVPPEPMTFDDIRRLAIEPKETVIADESIERLAVEYKDITKEMASAKKRKDALKTRIVKFMIQNQQGNIDDDSTQKLILRSESGHKLGQFDGKVYR